MEAHTKLTEYGIRQYMKRELMLLAILIATLGYAFSVFASEEEFQEELCPQVIVRSNEKLEFDDTEKRMLCGDPKLEPWSEIPPYQAQFFIKGFLQSRGYLTPTFKVEGDKLIAIVGDKTFLNQFLISPQELIEASDIENEIWRLYENKPLTPKLLNALEANVVGLMRERAYACAKFKALANGNNGVVVLTGEHLKRYKFGRVEKEKVEGLHKRALERYYPFNADQPFDASKLQLTEKRLTRAGVAEGSYFAESCNEEIQEFRLRHQLIVGPPRVLAFGVGVSSEVGTMFRARWGNNRYGPMASKLEATIKADFRNQSLRLTADNFLWSRHPRLSLLSEFEIAREEQDNYEETQTRLASHPKLTRDSHSRLWEWSAGPTLLSGRYVTEEGDDADGNFSGVAFEGDLRSVSHDFEIYDFLPEEGSSFRFHFDFRSPEFGFNERILKVEAEHTLLGRLWKWGRGDAVGGIRIGAHTTTVETPGLLEDLPPSVKYYGGGSDDIRGYGYRQLPENDGLGALTKLLTKFELRKTHFFRPALELFAFYDAAYFGFDSWELEPRLRQAPGLGLRWVSPVGLFQTFVSRGISTNPYNDDGTVVFFGLGGDF